jgi:hypothetical protein
MNLTCSRLSGHIKIDGAVIGRAYQGTAGVWIAELKVGDKPRFQDADKIALLKQVRDYLDPPEKPLPPPKAKRKVAARKKG